MSDEPSTKVFGAFEEVDSFRVMKKGVQKLDATVTIMGVTDYDDDDEATSYVATIQTRTKQS